MATAAGTVAAGASALDLDVVSDVDVDGLPDADGAGGALASGFAPSDLSVENGVFTGDGQELDRLIQYGEVDGTTHVASEDIVRDIGAMMGMGTHDTLLQTCDTYREIYFSQFPEERAQYAKAN